MSNLYEEHKKLKNRVQELEDELFKMKKYYEDALQNLSDDNFSASFVSEKRGMKTQISATAEAIKTRVTNTEFESRLEQTAGEIRAEVESADGELETKIATTAEGIETTIANYKERLKTAEGEIDGVQKEQTTIKEAQAEIKATADELTTKYSNVEERVSANESNITGLNQKTTAIEKNVTEVTQTAEGIKTTIGTLETTVAEKVDTSELESSAEELRAELEATSKEIKATVKKTFTTFQIVEDFNDISNPNEEIVYRDDSGFHYYDNGWRTSTNDNFFSQFRQTAEGFEMIGNLSTTTNDGTRVNVAGTRVDVYSNNDDSLKKMSFGTASSEEDYPVIMMGAGDSRSSIEVNGFAVRYGQGLIEKTENQFNMVYYVAEGKYPGMFITKNNDGSTMLSLVADEIQLSTGSLTAVAVFG